MGTAVEPARLTDSGEQALRRISKLAHAGLPAPQFITSCVAIVEAHVNGILGRLVAESEVARMVFGSALINHLSEDFVSTWPSRNAWLKKGFHLEYAGGRPYQQFNLVVEARNAIMHGGGQLSSKQRSKLDNALRLQRQLSTVLGVDAQGMMAYSAETGYRVWAIVREFVTDFDRLVVAVYPEIACPG